MKRIALFMAIAIAAIACKPEDPIIPEVKVTSSEDTFVVLTEGNEDDPLAVTFTTNVDWTASLDAASKEWCTITGTPAKFWV